MFENASIPSLELLLMTRLNNIRLLVDTLLLPADAVIRDTPLHSLLVINQHIIWLSG
jgi:hypothetical protein